jgi:hypothetical protein
MESRVLMHDLAAFERDWLTQLALALEQYEPHETRVWFVHTVLRFLEYV